MFKKVLRKFKKNNEEEIPCIEFLCEHGLQGAIPPPVPAHKAWPEWLKKLKRVPEGANIEDGTVKRCIPFIDIMSKGYIIPLWADLRIRVTPAYDLLDRDGNFIEHIEHPEETENIEEYIGRQINNKIVASIKENGLFIWCNFPKSFKTDKPTLESHGWQQVGDLCDLKRFSLGMVLMKFINPWIIKTPEGWSTIFKNPPNEWSNDICLIEAIVDTDTYHSYVNLPYVWTGNQKGEWLIPRGTPLLQVIPFKREETKYEIKNINYDDYMKVQNKLSSLLYDRYKKLFWHKRKEK